jgi:serine/threonine protein kinase
MTLERGALLNRRYRIIEILGQGGMGSVYRAVDENLGVEVAVKDNLFLTDEYARQFRREAVILANLRHPNLPRVMDHFVIEGQGQYLVMDYIDGEDLRQRMDRLGVLSDDEVIVVGAAICDALSYLDSRNPRVVHRDIKPGNIKVTPQGQIFLVDFGLAKLMESSQATTTGARAMTPGYSPPEQYGTGHTDQRSDIFSLGATLYAALTNAIPEDALARTMDQMGLSPIRKRNPRVGRRLASVIEKALEVKPDNRYQSADEFKEALLSCRSITRRKTGDLSITPPPAVIDRPFSAPEMIAVEPSPPVLKSPAISSPALLPISMPLEDAAPPSKHRRKWFQKRVWMILVALLLLLFAGGTLIYRWNPSLPSEALAKIQPFSAGTPASTEQQPTPESPTSENSLPSSTPPVQSTPLPPSPTTAHKNTTLPVSPPRLQTAITAVPEIIATPTPTPFGGGSGQIAFASDRSGISQIYLINTDGNQLQQLTNLAEGACQPAWSPQGDRLVFISPCDGNQESYPGSAMFLINADGSGLTPLDTVPGGDYDPAWSPDGQQIAFTSLRVSGRPHLYLYNLESRTLTSLSEKYAADMQPAWSIDGSQLAFVTTRRDTHQVWIMDADGKNQQRFSRSIGLVEQYPTWSPDGKFILFTQMVALGGIPRLIVAPVLEPQNMYKITQDQLPMREGHYSPDGLWIAFEGWPAGANHDIYIIASNGGARQQVTTNDRSDFDPAWRPAQ